MTPNLCIVNYDPITEPLLISSIGNAKCHCYLFVIIRVMLRGQPKKGLINVFI